MSPTNSITLAVAAGPAETSMPREFVAWCFATLAFLGAALATTASLGIAAYAGWQRGGLPVERAMNITLADVAVLFIHVLPVSWRQLRLSARMCAFSLWWVGVVVVLYGQITFLVVSQQHAGNVRAASVPVTVLPPATNDSPSLKRSELAQDIMQVTMALVRANAGHCEVECRALAMRRGTLAARLAELNVELDETVRREAEYDRRVLQSDRAEALRATLRADPVVTVVASRLRTTGGNVELVLALACAVVLDGAAVLGWLLLPVAIGRARGCNVVAPGRELTMGGLHSVDPPPFDDTHERSPDRIEPASPAPVRDTTLGGIDAEPLWFEDERLLIEIHDAVQAGEVTPTQQSIRKMLRCGQPKAGRLNRLYQERYGHRWPKQNGSKAPRPDALDATDV